MVYLTTDMFFVKGANINVYKCKHYDTGLHTHDFFEVCFVTEGKAKHLIRNLEYDIATGDIFVISNTEPHSLYGGTELEVINCMFTPDALENKLTDLNNIVGFKEFFCIEPLFRKEDRFTRKLHISGFDELYVRQHLEKMLTELATIQPGWQLTLKCQFLEFLIIISRLYAAFLEKANTTNEFNYKSSIITQVISHINAHIDSNFRLDDIANMVNLSSSHFCKIFKDATGRTLFEFINQCRINEACALLRTTNLLVTEICLNVGFNDLSYFNQVFRNQTGKCPTNYRKQFKAKKASVCRKSD